MNIIFISYFQIKIIILVWQFFRVTDLNAVNSILLINSPQAGYKIPSGSSDV